MKEAKELDVFEHYIDEKSLKHSKQREEILDIFLKLDKHLSADELYRIVKKKYPTIGFATVYRTLKLLCESGLSRELKLEDGVTRYEHLYNHKHHDHLVCTKCGKFVEVVDTEIEKLQERLAAKHGFSVQRHRMELYGLCRSCNKG